MLRRIRIILAVIFLLGTAALFLDFTGTVAPYTGWMAKVQFLPALLAANVIVVAALLALTLILGRVYCSVICPLGVTQDIFARLVRRSRRNRYTYSPARTWMRYVFLAVAVIGFLWAGWLLALLAPYGTFGRIMQNLFQPIWIAANNLLAQWSESAGNYMFYHRDIVLGSWLTLTVAIASLALIGFLSWRNGRTWCNTVCPVGSVLGFVARFSLLKPVIDASKCNSCTLCSRNCKASCIDSKAHRIDYSRCVACMDCIGTCHRGAISYRLDLRFSRGSADNATTDKSIDESRRTMIASTLAVAAGSMLKAEEKLVDGGLAVIEDKLRPRRLTRIVPAGAHSLKSFEHKCVACQLCVAECPEHVLSPSTDLAHLMQPERSYERGYCRPECTRCSEVCPAGAISPITAAEKTSIQVGHAIWVPDNCVVLTDSVSCGNCARHCPVEAITMATVAGQDNESLKTPVIDTERCIGCGACENLCPSRPFSAIYVEGHEVHRTV